MPRTQIAFRLDYDKANQFKQQVEAEGRSLNTVLESLVEAYLSGKLADDSNKLTERDDRAIAQLRERLNNLEEQLAPVINLLANNQSADDVIKKLTTVITPPADITPSESPLEAMELTDQDKSYSESPEALEETKKEELGKDNSVNNKTTSVNSNEKRKNDNTETQEQIVSTELPSVSNQQITSDNTQAGSNSDSSKLTSVSTTDSENTISELPLEETKPSDDEKSPSDFSEFHSRDWMQPKDFANYLAKKLGRSVTIKNITDRFSKAKNKEQTPEGYEQCVFRDLIVQRRKSHANAGRNYEYRYVGEN